MYGYQFSCFSDEYFLSQFLNWNSFQCLCLLHIPLLNVTCGKHCAIVILHTQGWPLHDNFQLVPYHIRRQPSSGGRFNLHDLSRITWHPPPQTMLRIWDTFLYEGSKVLFRFAIAIFKYNEEKLLNIENSIGIFNRLRGMCQDATDVTKLTHVCLFVFCSVWVSVCMSAFAYYVCHIDSVCACLT